MKILFALIFFIMTLSSCNKVTLNERPSSTERKWWKEAVVYQIYPRSFKDSDGDGVGDLKGIIEKLDYVKSLGVNVVWLNPIYQSPNDDNGYDISDYRKIMKEFGTMEDFDLMLNEMHKRDIKFVMDVVVNHSSDEHDWFKQSRSSRDNPYRNYYHWWPAEKGKPNYRYSLFDEKGDAWKYDATTDSYYLHYFSQKQPDLNWENPKVRQEVHSIMKFWADKGVDGFRLDAFGFAAKDITFPAFPEGYEKNFMKYYAMQGDLHKYIQEMNQEVFSKYDVMTVAEGAGNSFEDAHNLVDAERKELNMAYAFDAVDLVKVEGYKLTDFKELYTLWDSAFSKKGWLSIFLANHDQARMVSRYASENPEFRAASSKMLNTFLLTMRGTPYCYYGDELGMTNIGFETIDEYQDIAAINGYKKTLSKGGDIDLYMRELKFLSRDNGRTPMQWDNSINAGFTTGTSWLPVNNNYKEINVASEEKDPNSALNYFRKMVQLRKDNLVLVYGDYGLIQPDHEQIYAYIRSLEDQRMLVLLNFSETAASINLEEYDGEIIINNYESIDIGDGKITLQPYQSVILKLS